MEGIYQETPNEEELHLPGEAASPGVLASQESCPRADQHASNRTNGARMASSERPCGAKTALVSILST